jgi:hypothetical protein
MESAVDTGSVTRDTQTVTVKFGKAESYTIQFGVWRRFQQTLMRAALSVTSNGGRISAHQFNDPAMNYTEDGGKQSCQAVIL